MLKNSDSVKTHKKRFFKTQWDGVACDVKKIVYPPRIVDSSQYEPVDVLIKKLKSGDRQLVEDTYFEVGDKSDVKRAMDSMDITRTSGFDLSDASAAISQGVNAVQSEVEKSKKKKAEKPLSPGEGANPKPLPAEDAGKSVKQ